MPFTTNQIRRKLATMSVVDVAKEFYSQNWGVSNNGAFTIAGANDTFFYSSDGNLTVGTASTSKKLIFFTGGTLAANARMTIDAIKEFQIDWLIVDSYLLGVEWQIKMREVAKKIMVIDDLAESKHYCDLLLNQNSNELELNYKESLNKEFIGLFGPGYSLLRDEFLMLRPKKLEPIAEIKSILIFLSNSSHARQYQAPLNFLKNLCKERIFCF